MNQTLELVLRTLSAGVGATVVMDLWAATLRKLGVPSLNFALLGRWVAHLPKGRWFHGSIASAPAVRGERWIGWVAHYVIGVSFAVLLIAIAGLEWARNPALLPALAIGAVTVVAPWFVLQPAMGLGIASSKTRAPAQNALKSLVTHLVYGLGLYLSALATASLLPAG